MGRKNRRKSTEYHKGLGFNPKKYLNTAIYKSHKNHIIRKPKRGDIWFAELEPHHGTSVQGGCRPVLIVSNDIGNYHAETINVLPATKHMKKPDLPCHTQISLGELTDLHHHFDYSMLLAEQITTISKSQLRNYVGKVDDADAMRRINTIINRQLDLDTYEQSEAVTTEEEKNGK